MQFFYMLPNISGGTRLEGRSHLVAGLPSDEKFVAEALEVAAHMENAQIPVRIMAGCAVRIHCPNSAELHKVKMQRNIRDVDFATLSKYRKDIKESLRGLGYDFQLAMMGMDRDIYHNPKKSMTVDIFFDKINMCHVIDFRDRLQNDSPTLTLADLVLQKLQIVEINERDVKDLIVLLLDHEVGDSDRETIDASYIAKLLSEDWGFYHTSTTNLRKTEDTAKSRYSDLLSSDALENIHSKIEQMLSRIEVYPKSLKWKMRQKVGTKAIWYNEVEEKERGTLADYLMKKNEEGRTRV